MKTKAHTMKRLNTLLSEITAITLRIETDYPELYVFLNENPLTLPVQAKAELDTNVLADYLESLKELLQHHIESHPNKK